MLAKASLLSLLIVLAACGDDGSNASADDSADAAVANICAPAPGRLIVLGDSIMACTGVDGKMASTCAPKIFHSSLAAGHAPGVVYQNLSVPGAVTKTVPNGQINSVATGPGHVLVLVYVGGNDLQNYLTQSDAAAEAGLRADLPGFVTDWRAVFAFFNDTANFPDGATIIMNNQYNPFDDCTTAPYNLSAKKTELVGEYNAELAALADEHDNVTITDQHTAYLGHGHHYADAVCPHFIADATPFMNDLIHPNAAGHANLAAQWSAVADGLYGDCE